jgi:hypothetical protein
MRRMQSSGSTSSSHPISSSQSKSQAEETAKSVKDAAAIEMRLFPRESSQGI